MNLFHFYRFGRRRTMLVASVIQIVASIAAAFSVNYIMFIFLRFLVAFSVSGVFECGFVLGKKISQRAFQQNLILALRKRGTSLIFGSQKISHRHNPYF